LIWTDVVCFQCGRFGLVQGSWRKLRRRHTLAATGLLRNKDLCWGELHLGVTSGHWKNASRYKLL
jgi:hypothetical protein